MKLDLHVHTSASHDGSINPKEVVNQARRKGLDGIAITDHNTVDGFRAARESKEVDDFLLIPGIEVSTDKGHVLVLGTDREPDSRSFEDVLDFAKENDAVTVAAHPFSVFRESIEPELVERLDAMEVLNGKTYSYFNEKAREFAEEKNMPQIASSDAHEKEGLGRIWTEVEGGSQPEVLEKIKKGRCEPKGENTSVVPLTLTKIRSRLR